MPNLKTVNKKSDSNGDTANLHAANEKLTEQVTALTKRMSDLASEFGTQANKIHYLEGQNQQLREKLDGKPLEKKSRPKVAITVDNIEARLRDSGMSPKKQREILQKTR